MLPIDTVLRRVNWGVAPHMWTCLLTPYCSLWIEGIPHACGFKLRPPFQHRPCCTEWSFGWGEFPLNGTCRPLSLSDRGNLNSYHWMSHASCDHNWDVAFLRQYIPDWINRASGKKCWKRNIRCHSVNCDLALTSATVRVLRWTSPSHISTDCLRRIFKRKTTRSKWDRRQNILRLVLAWKIFIRRWELGSTWETWEEMVNLSWADNQRVQLTDRDASLALSDGCVHCGLAVD